MVASQEANLGGMDEWTAQSGAQKCPACRKLIEKNDPEKGMYIV